MLQVYCRYMIATEGTCYVFIYRFWPPKGIGWPFGTSLWRGNWHRDRCKIYHHWGIYPVVNKHRPWKSPICNGNIRLPTPTTARVELLIYQRVIENPPNIHAGITGIDGICWYFLLWKIVYCIVVDVNVLGIHKIFSKWLARFLIMSTPDFAKPWFMKIRGGTPPIVIYNLILFYGTLPIKQP